ncbi:hypothetical protein PV08_08419 [Exophiala spinifera]|uniref:Uncharacterized protein n=1 Tax=Exophiala spinifera TaxID=91928 RepID=A0A0D1ZK74_9EURO|nr:uncharacterized protein PV08_08419 [Exophiala spinifera]KIW13232.1 hypothetical protein PV08_08419 [Exophiala spinifera]
MKKPVMNRRNRPLTFQSNRSVDDIRNPASPKSVSFTSHDHNRSGRGSAKRGSHRISKVKDNDTNPSPRQLDRYRSSVHDAVTKDFDNVEKNLLTSLEELSVDFDNHIGKLTSIEEPLGKPFATETLSILKEGDEQQQEVLLQDQVAAFRKLRADKEEILRRLWEEWEGTQLQLIGLAAEVLGQDALTFAQVRDEDLKPGQREKLQSTLTNAQRLFDKKREHQEGLQQHLGAFEENIGQIASKTEKTVVEMQQQYNTQKSKLFKGLHRHIELLAAL